MILKEITLRDIGGFFEKKSSSIASICFFMQKIRLLIEIDNTQDNYKIVNHYCNWLFHKNLDRGKSPFIIKEIEESFKNAKSKNDLIKKINSTLSLKELVIGIKEILYKNISFKYEHYIENDEFWINFLIILVNDIKYRPLLLCKKNSVRNGFLKNHDFSIYGIQLITIKDKIVIEILSDELDFQKKHLYIDLVVFR